MDRDRVNNLECLGSGATVSAQLGGTRPSRESLLPDVLFPCCQNHVVERHHRAAGTELCPCSQSVSSNIPHPCRDHAYHLSQPSLESNETYPSGWTHTYGPTGELEILPYFYHWIKSNCLKTGKNSKAATVPSRMKGGNGTRLGVY